MIGQYNRRIEIWKPSGAVDSANEPLPDAWVLHKQRWAHVRGETGMGSIRATDGVNVPLNRYSFRINYDRTIGTDMQIRDPDGDRFNILTVRHDKADREWTDIVAELGGSNG